jgi:hypothetical protein
MCLSLFVFFVLSVVNRFFKVKSVKMGGRRDQCQAPGEPLKHEEDDLDEKFARLTEHWRRMIVGALNSQEVKIVKFKGPSFWRKHEPVLAVSIQSVGGAHAARVPSPPARRRLFSAHFSIP